jgi:hypothetical protein
MALLGRKGNTRMLIEKKQYELCSEGIHYAIIREIKDLGPQKSVYNGQEKVIDKLQITYELTDEKDSTGKPFLVFSRMSKSLGKKANLLKLITTLGFDPSVASFNTDEMLGLRVQLVIVHNSVKETGQTFANVETVVRPRGSANFFCVPQAGEPKQVETI